MRTWLLLSLLTATVDAKESVINSSAEDQRELYLTVYQRDLVQVSEQRQLKLPAGQVRLQLKDVSAQLQAESLLISADREAQGPRILEQSFNQDLLTPKNLLEQYLGREVRLVKTHPTTGQEQGEPATLLSTQQGVVLRTQGHIEVGIPGRLIFPEVPETLVTSPTISLLLENTKAQNRTLTFSYLSRGMQWHADYVAELQQDGELLDLTAWATISNNTGADFNQAHWRLVAGEVQQSSKQVSFASRAMAAGEERDQLVSNMELSSHQADYHLINLPNVTSLQNHQQKQLQLFSAQQIPVKKQYELLGQPYYYHAAQPSAPQRQQAQIRLQFTNQAGKPGIPLPQGTLRLYQRSSAPLLFVGETTLPATPRGTEASLLLGQAFDLTATRRQLDFKRQPGAQPHLTETESSHEIRITNSSDKEQRVHVIEPIPGDWKILETSHPQQKEDAQHAGWQLKIKAKQELVLKYRVRIRS